MGRDKQNEKIDMAVAKGLQLIGLTDRPTVDIPQLPVNSSTSQRQPAEDKDSRFIIGNTSRIDADLE